MPRCYREPSWLYVFEITLGGLVEGGGFSFDNVSGSPLDIPWIIYNGPSAGSLTVKAEQSTSYFHQIFTVPIGSVFQTRIHNNISDQASFQMQQSESVLN
jgi:hypothetical protein